jgi:cytochrome c2
MQRERKVSQLTIARRFTVGMVAGVTALSVLAVSPALAAGDPARGKVLFKSTCEVCHLAIRDASRNDEATKIGPNLFGVIGRRAGTHPGFHYSQAMKMSGITWSKEALRPYITDPQKAIPNVRMSFKGLKDPRGVDDIVAYLITLK